MEEHVIPLDAETKVAERPHDHRDELRLWLRLFTCKELIESEVRRRLRDSFKVTLPRFDLMAQLDRAAKGMTLGELSRRMMVTGGNVTGITDLLEREGLVARIGDPDDRRALRVRLTVAGRRSFRAMAAAHERWIVEAFAALDRDDLGRLADLLGKLKTHIRRAEESTI